MQTYLWIGVGGALGSVARHWCNSAAAAAFGATFPWGTLIVNVLGSAVIGLAAAAMSADGRFPVGDDVRAFLMIGICGGFTTFSAFSLQTLSLVQTGQWLSATANVVLSVALCLMAVWLGHAAGMAMRQL